MNSRKMYSKTFATENKYDCYKQNNRGIMRCTLFLLITLYYNYFRDETKILAEAEISQKVLTPGYVPPLFIILIKR